jgi:hypothetical protein
VLALAGPLGVVRAGPGLFAATVYAPCPEAVLPMRLGVFQAPAGEPLDVARSVALDDLKEAQAWVSARSDAGDIAVVVFAYVGSLAEALLVEIARPGGEPTWRAEVALDPPDAGIATLSFYPYYAAVEVARDDWATAFPERGPYLLRASRAAGAASTYPEAFCDAEATSWVLVVR